MLDIDESDCIMVQKGGKGGEVESKIRGAGVGFERGVGEYGALSLRGEGDST
jgi:hypothetical protein